MLKKKGKYVDNRDWKKTNEKYVMIGYFYFKDDKKIKRDS